MGNNNGKDIALTRVFTKSINSQHSGITKITGLVDGEQDFTILT